MDRRGFLRSMIGGVAAAAAVRTFFFRVFSFPTEIVIPSVDPLFDQISAATLAELRADILYDSFFVDTPWLRKLKKAGELDKYFVGEPIQTPFRYDSV